ncbi:MAG: flagellar basal body rod protein FlgF [Cellvibrionaceae bacterium]
MDRALYVAMTSAKNTMMAQTIHSNNLANVNTQGFKADFAQARAQGVYYGDGFPTRAFSQTENPATDFSQGTVMSTGRDFDVAVESSGFIAVQAPDGTEAYTRNGHMFVDTFGVLRTGENLPVLGNGGPIALPDYQKAEIGSDGSISVLAKGEAPETMAAIDRMKLVNPDESQMVKSPDGLYRLKDNTVAEEDVNVRVMSGFLEASNVNAVDELTNILSLSRQYEMSVKLMQTIDQSSEASAKLLQIS